jgi:ATP-dependent helicase/nuclease subunit B
VRFSLNRKAAPAGPASARPGRVYTVAPGCPFFPALAEELAAGRLPTPTGRRPGPLELADTTLYLPTRQATRPLQEAFLKASGGSALLLPRIKAISEGSEDLDLLASVEDYSAAGAAGVPRVISDLQRRLVLTSLVLRWATGEGRGRKRSLDPVHSTGARTPAQAAKLAKELACLIDALEADDVDAARLGALVPEEYSEHWSHTLAFLEIVTDFWPRHLAENNLVSPVGRRKRLIKAEVERLEAAPPGAPVIVAGVTAADAAATELIRAVLALPNGALVLPALDQTLDEASWTAVGDHPEHPQFGLKKLLDALGIARADVRPLGERAPAPVEGARWALACEAMRPAATTERWHRFAAAANKEHMAAALKDVCAIEAATAEEEAEVIALMLREAVETPGRTARLITPDRGLARRVSARLKVWDIDAEDTAGVPFGRTVPGGFLDLVAAAAEKEFEPVALMALLKHPLCRVGMAAPDLRRAISALELAAFRSPYFGRGLDGVEAAFEAAQKQSRRSRAVRVGQAGAQAARDLLARLAAIFKPLADALVSPESTSVHELARLHYATAQALARTDDRDDGSALRHGEAGEWAAQFFASLIDPSMPAPDMAAHDYPDFYRTLVSDKFVRSRNTTHPRISICDPVTARLQQADLVILGSLNEGTWPHAADPGPWLSRQMRQALGLPAPEERIGAAVHDFVSQLGAAQVVLTRAAKVDGAPTVASRLLLRLEALTAGLGLNLQPERPWLAWAHLRTAPPGPPQPAAPPEPRPPVAWRPRELSVTSIEKWIANPYAIYAQRILRLDPLPLLGERPGPALRGQIVHDALNRFAQRFPERLPSDIAGELMGIAREVLADYTSNPRVAAFWAQRLDRFAGWFAETEAERRAGVARTVSEAAGKLVLAAPGGPFTLTARADRIDVGAVGLIVTDYKSSQNLQPLASKAASGEAPQLPLEAAIAEAGGFAGVPEGRVAQLGYISTSGGEPAGQDVPLKVDDVAALARKAHCGLSRLVAEFDRETTPYRAVRRARFNYDYDDYAHLARVAEWLVDMGEEDA